MATKYKYNEKRKEWATLVYDGTLTPSGEKRRRRISSKKSSKDLENKVAAFKLSLNTEAAPSMITFREYALKWLDLYKSNKEINTRAMYRNALNYFDSINEKRLSDLTRSDFQFIINENKEHPRTCIIIKQTFSQILKSAVLDGYLSDKALRNITTSISLPKYQKAEKTPLTTLERDALLNCELPEQARALVTVLYYCGLRKSEALALTSADFDFNNNIVQINKAIVYDNNTPVLKPYPKSDNGVRAVPLCEPCIALLKDYVINNKGTLFKSQNSPYLTGTVYRNTWRSIIKSCNEYLEAPADDPVITNLTAHRLRHNFCSLLCYQVPRISTKTIARILGDTEEMVLSVYSHIMEEKEDLTGAIEDAFKV